MKPSLCGTSLERGAGRSATSLLLCRPLRRFNRKRRRRYALPASSKRSRLFLFILALALLPPLLPAPISAAPAAPASPAATSLFEDPVIARGRGVEIHRSDLDNAFIAFKANMAARKQTIRNSERSLLEAQLLEQLIVTQLLINRTTDADRPKARELAERKFADLKKMAPSEELFAAQLKSLGLTVDQFHIRLMEQAWAETVLDRELVSQIAVEDAAVKKFYETGADVLTEVMEAEIERRAQAGGADAQELAAARERVAALKRQNLDQLLLPERVRVSHVLLATHDLNTEAPLPAKEREAKLERAREVLAKARAGEDFAKLIETYSEDRRIEETKGEYTFSREDPLVPQFKAAAFSLEPAQISDIVTTAFGYHIIKLHERIPAKKISYEEAHPRISEHLRQQEIQRRLPDYFAQLKKEAAVEILDPKYKVELPADALPLKPPGIP